ncbi:MAG: methylenetetrahydrofolate reductase [Gammaproteobacteria bacterium]|nr:methylenetetrahydrofolate reductase [Gammaproteobacteria bacterium]
MTFNDEPPERGTPLSIRPGHSSPGRLERVLRAGNFAVTAELSPPDSADPEEVYARARVFDGFVDAMNATDGAGANCHMSSVGVCALLSRVGYSTVLQVSCRDRNRIAIQGDVLGAAAMGVASILCLTGDGVQAGDEPEAKPVFDFDSVSLLRAVRIMRDESRLLTGRKLATPPRVFIGAAANPFVPPHDYQVLKLNKKIAAGAQFIQTQYCFDAPRLNEFMREVRALDLHKQVFILVGVGVLSSAQAARWIRNHVPGVHIPDAVIERLERASNPQDEGKQISIEIIREIRDIEGVAGIHVMAYHQEHTIAEIIERTDVLEGRVCWFPECDATQACLSASAK